MSDELHTLPLRRAASFLREGSITAVSLLAHYRERIGRLNPQLNAIVTLDDAMTDAAHAADERLRTGRARSVLDGIPVAIKDNLSVKCLRTTWGTRLYADYVPDRDELPIARLREAGAVIVGKTNVPAFTLEGYTDNALFGVTRNPWNLALTPGGSSGGAVAAVAAGLVPLAICTDGGGSIRRPAAHTGLVGLKPGTGRVARGHGLPEILGDFEVVGPIARRVDDVRLAMEVLAGSDRLDQRSRRYPPFGGADEGERATLSILCVDRLGDHPIDPAISESFRGAVSKMQALGHDIHHGPLPLEIEGMAACWSLIGKVGLAMLAARTPRFMALCEKKYRGMAQDGAKIFASEHLAALSAISAFRSQVGVLFSKFDIVMMPCTAAQPWEASAAYPTSIDGREVGPRGHAVFTGWVNVSGHPAISLPGAPDEAGMPIGFQLVADFGREERLLKLAAEYEVLVQYPQRWPAVAVA